MIALLAGWILLMLEWPAQILPSYYATLDNILASQDLNQLTNTLIGYGLIDGTLIALMYLRVKSAELKF